MLFSNSIYAKMRKIWKFVIETERRTEHDTKQWSEVKHVHNYYFGSCSSFICLKKRCGTHKKKVFRSTMTNKEKCVMPNSISYCWKYFFFLEEVKNVQTHCCCYLLPTILLPYFDFSPYVCVSMNEDEKYSREKVENVDCTVTNK